MSALDEVRNLAEAVATRRCLRLWDVEFGGRPGSSIVRVFVHGEEGVDLDTVAQISEEISRALDLKDPIPGRYTLEVSSPGLERSLRTPDHFKQSVGDKAVVKTTEIVAGNSHRLEGTIGAAGAEHVVLDIGDEEKVEVPYERIKSARTVFEWGSRS